MWGRHSLNAWKVAINTTLRAKYGYIYSREIPGLIFVLEFWWEKNICHFLKLKITLNHAFSHFCKKNLLQFGYMTEIATIYVIDSRQWATKVIEPLLGNEAFRYLRRWSLCSPRNRRIKIVWERREKDVSKTLENRILLCLKSLVARCSLDV